MSVSDLNVLGEPLALCGLDPVTGFFRDGCCRTGPEDLGSHTVCAVVNADFREHQREIGNHLITPVLQLRFPGLTPGDRWCVTAIADTNVFDSFVRLIKAEGYRARYRAPYRPTT